MDLIKQQTNSLYPVETQDISQRIEKAVNQIAEMAPVVFKTWNRSHSDMTWNTMNLDHETDTRNLREIGASIQRRRDALTEVHFAYKECLANVKVHEELAQEFYDQGKNAQGEREMLFSQKESAFAQMKHEAVMGATKDISALKASYDKILDRIVAKHGKFDEEIFEKEEKEYWIRRLMVQAMRDVRMTKNIQVGAQRDLEQIGIEPLEALSDILHYLHTVEKRLSVGEEILREDRDKWAEGCAKKYMSRLTKKLDNMGCTLDHLYRLEESDGD
jgi:hypothetical protein